MQSAPELGRLLGDLTAKDTMLLSPRDKAHVLSALRRDVSPSKTAAFDADDPSEELTEEEELVGTHNEYKSKGSDISIAT